VKKGLRRLILVKILLLDSESAFDRWILGDLFFLGCMDVAHLQACVYVDVNKTVNTLCVCVCVCVFVSAWPWLRSEHGHGHGHGVNGQNYDKFKVLDWDVAISLISPCLYIHLSVHTYTHTYILGCGDITSFILFVSSDHTYRHTHILMKRETQSGARG
jgi:hypothetical protein